jgi:hypothetical protein
MDDFPKSSESLFAHNELVYNELTPPAHGAALGTIVALKKMDKYGPVMRRLP